MPRSLVVILTLLCACTPEPQESATNASQVGAVADLSRGEILSFACQACHTLGEGEGILLGPNLFGVFGRAAASADGFVYSEALRESGIVWTAEILDDWLADPRRFVPGNNMVFAGYKSASDRRDLIAFLLHKTGAASD